MREDRRLAQRQDRRDRGTRGRSPSGKTPRAERAAQRELRRRRQRAQIGIEFDGSTVRIVEVHDGEIVWLRAYGPEMPGVDAIRDWIDSRPRKSRHSSEPVVTWAGSDSHLRVVEVLSYSTTALSRRLNSALEGDLPERPGTYVLSAMKGPEMTVDVAADAGLSALGDDAIEVAFDTMSVVAIEALSVDDIWQALVDVKADLTASEFTLSQDGLYLSLRNSRAALVLRSNGIPRVSRDLPVGGFDELLGRASDSGREPSEVLDYMLGGAPSMLSAAAESGSSDAGDAADSGTAGPFADIAGDRVFEGELKSMVDSYAFSLASEVRASVGYWQGLGLAVPADVQISGLGAAISGVTNHFDFMGLQASPAVLPASIRTNGTPYRDVAAFHGALTAAVASPDVSLGFVNPLKEQARQRRREMRQRAVRGVVIIAIAALCGWFLMRPYLSAQTDLDAAIDARNKAAATASQRAGIETYLRDVGSAQTSTVALSLAEPHWAVAIESLRSVDPANASMLTMELTTGSCTAGPPSATEDQQDAEAQPEETADDEPATLDDTLPGVACISVAMLAALPEVESGDQRLIETAQWVRNLEGIGGLGVWPSVSSVAVEEAPEPDITDETDPEAQPEPSIEDEQAAAEPEPEIPEEAVETDAASLSNDAKLALLMELNLPNAPPYRAPRDIALSGQSLDGDNG